MATRIPRHEFRTDNAAAAMAPVSESAAEALAGLETSEDDRYDALTLTLAAAKWHCLADPIADRFTTWEAWILAMQAGTALFAAGQATEGTVTCRIGVNGEERELPATGPQEYLHAGNWLTAFYLTAICRENERVNQLAQVPLSFLRESGAEFDDYLYSWVETLQNRWFGRQETWDTLVRAVDGTDPANVRIAEKELMLKILYPPLNLFHRYLSQESELFNEALAEALTWHKEYWTTSEARARSAEGLVALGPLAIACMAHDAGMPIEVESEYLPKELLEFGWAGEVDA
ncbi:immunity 49 family protein [Streptomyces antarcticus]|uniref:immunity 49 family protein n=1 Tax=Streptomyces antarcticus TaxID=2996458 RepID=UPI002270F2E0|nr:MULTISPECIES: immunity 49 family protein [unclassified Streptomyces]MCY0946463.1 immunity 49 family protein [Streptomyces sp. H34-AA3]MCZ4087425.1 immunity 49 family protein [Streptomyces sp. H34-S5]